MINRRSLLKSLGLSAVSFSTLTGFASPLENVDESDFPIEGDPQYRDKIRGQFMLSKEKVFFNCGTVGVMPKPVFDKMAEHSRYLATHDMRPRSQGDQFGVRHSTHIFNSVEEIDKAINVVNELSV